MLAAFWIFLQDTNWLGIFRGTLLHACLRLMWLTITTFVLHVSLHIPGNIILYGLGRPISEKNKFNRYICRLWSHFFLAYIVSRPRILLYGDRHDFKDSYLIQCNHQVDTDWIWNWVINHRMKRHGNTIIMLKDEAKYVPFYGTAMLFFGYVFMKREWDKDKNSLIKTLGHLLHEQDPFWLLVFPEGTRFKKSSLNLAQQFAKERNMYSPNFCLLPRYKGINATLKVLGDRFDYFMDVTMAYEDPMETCTLYEMSKGCGPKTVHVHFKKTPMKEMPKPDDEVKLTSHWYKIWEEKDRLLAEFDKKKKFDGVPYELPNTRETDLINFIIFLAFIANAFLIVHYIWFFVIALFLVAGALYVILRTTE